MLYWFSGFRSGSFFNNNSCCRFWTSGMQSSSYVCVNTFSVYDWASYKKGWFINLSKKTQKTTKTRNARLYSRKAQPLFNVVLCPLYRSLKWMNKSLSNSLNTPEINAQCRIRSGVKLSFVANGIIKLQILTLDEGKYAFNVPSFDFRQAYKRTKLMLVLSLPEYESKNEANGHRDGTCSLSAPLLCASAWTLVTYRCRYNTESIKARYWTQLELKEQEKALSTPPSPSALTEATDFQIVLRMGSVTLHGSRNWPLSERASRLSGR